MALADFLGETAEIRIVDFLLENRDLEYNQTELAQCIGLSRTTIHDKIPALIYNRLIKVSRTVGRSKLFQIEDNAIIGGLTKAVFANSFIIAEEERDEGEALNHIQEEIKSPYEEPVEYSTPSHHELELADVTTWRMTIKIPEEAFGKEPFIGEVPMMTTPTSTSGEKISSVRHEYKQPKRPVTI